MGWRTYSTQYAMADAWDEMFERPGEPRPAYRSLFAALQPLAGTELRVRADQLARVFTDRGVTFAYAGEERPFPLDLVPRIIDAAEWDLIDPGGAAAGQRAGGVPGRRLRARPGASPTGSCPAGWSLTSAHFHREAHGIEPANGVRVHVAGIDLVRDEAGAVPGAGGQPAHPVRVSATSSRTAGR